MKLIKPTIEDLLVFANDIASFVSEYGRDYGFMDIETSELFKVLSSAIMDARGFVLLAVKDDKAVGFFIGSVFNELFTGKLVGNQNAVYIKSRSGNALEMIKEFERYCKSIGCKSVYTHVKDCDNFDRWQKAYSRLGYKPSELRFNKEL